MLKTHYLLLFWDSHMELLNCSIGRKGMQNFGLVGWNICQFVDADSTLFMSTQVRMTLLSQLALPLLAHDVVF